MHWPFSPETLVWCSPCLPLSSIFGCVSVISSPSTYWYTPSYPSLFLPLTLSDCRCGRLLSLASLSARRSTMLINSTPPPLADTMMMFCVFSKNFAISAFFALILPENIKVVGPVNWEHSNGWDGLLITFITPYWWGMTKIFELALLFSQIVTCKLLHLVGF